MSALHELASTGTSAFPAGDGTLVAADLAARLTRQWTLASRAPGAASGRTRLLAALASYAAVAHAVNGSAASSDAAAAKLTLIDAEYVSALKTVGAAAGYDLTTELPQLTLSNRAGPPRAQP